MIIPSVSPIQKLRIATKILSAESTSHRYNTPQGEGIGYYWEGHYERGSYW